MCVCLTTSSQVLVVKQARKPFCDFDHEINTCTCRWG